MKRKKIIVIVVTVIVVLILGTWFSWHCVNMIAQKKLDEIAAEYEPIDIPAERRQQIYDTGEDILYWMNFYDGGGNSSQVLEMLQFDKDKLADYKEDEYLESIEQTASGAMALATDNLIRKIKMNDQDTAEEIEEIKLLMQYFEQQGLPEDKE